MNWKNSLQVLTMAHTSEVGASMTAMAREAMV
jgi:hypothetical protein